MFTVVQFMLTYFHGHYSPNRTGPNLNTMKWWLPRGHSGAARRPHWELVFLSWPPISLVFYMNTLIYWTVWTRLSLYPKLLSYLLFISGGLPRRYSRRDIWTLTEILFDWPGREGWDLQMLRAWHLIRLLTISKQPGRFHRQGSPGDRQTFSEPPL